MIKRLYNEGEERLMHKAMDAFLERRDARPWHDASRIADKKEAMERKSVVDKLRLARVAGVYLDETAPRVIEQFLSHIHATYGKAVSASQLRRWEQLSRHSITAIIPRFEPRRRPPMRPAKLPSRTRLIAPEDADRCAGHIGLPLVKAKEAVKRWAILRRWQAAVVGGKELGFDTEQVSQRFLKVIQNRFGMVVSRATLYRWDRLSRSGFAALVDHRRVRKSRQQSDHCRGIEGRS